MSFNPSREEGERDYALGGRKRYEQLRLKKSSETNERKPRQVTNRLGEEKIERNTPLFKSKGRLYC